MTDAAKFSECANKKNNTRSCSSSVQGSGHAQSSSSNTRYNRLARGMKRNQVSCRKNDSGKDQDSSSSSIGTNASNSSTKANPKDKRFGRSSSILSDVSCNIKRWLLVLPEHCLQLQKTRSSSEQETLNMGP